MPTNIHHFSLVVDSRNIPYISFVDDAQQLHVLAYSSSDWTSLYSAKQVTSASLALGMSDDLYLGYITSSGEVRLRSHRGEFWAIVGNSLTVPSIDYEISSCDRDEDEDTRFMIANRTTESKRFYSFDREWSPRSPFLSSFTITGCAAEEGIVAHVPCCTNNDYSGCVSVIQYVVQPSNSSRGGDSEFKEGLSVSSVVIVTCSFLLAVVLVYIMFRRSRSRMPGSASDSAPNYDSNRHTYNCDISNSPGEQEDLARLIANLPWNERTVLGTHVIEVVWVFLVCVAQGIIWYFFAPFKSSTPAIMSVTLTLVGTWIYTLRVNFFVKKYYCLAMAMYHDVNLLSICKPLNAFSLRKLDEFRQQQQPEKRWLFVLPYRFGLYFQFFSLILAVFQICRTVLVPYGSDNAASSALDVTVLNVFHVHTRAQFDLLFWTSMAVIYALILFSGCSILVPFLMCEPWAVRYAKLLNQAVKLAEFETRPYLFSLSFLFRLFIKGFEWLIRWRDKPRVADRPWTVAYLTTVAQITEILFIPSCMVLVRILSCNSDGALIQLDSIQCWTAEHEPYVLASMSVILPWYFMSVFANSWANIFFAFDECLARDHDYTPVLRADTIILFSSVYQYRVFSIRMMIICLATALGPLFPGPISSIVALFCLLIVFTHDVRIRTCFSPSNVASVNFWNGCALCIGAGFAFLIPILILSNAPVLALYILVGVLLVGSISVSTILWIRLKRTESSAEREAIRQRLIPANTKDFTYDSANATQTFV
eukprot:ANDGO_01385.mRNA.1 hypothetical protein